MKSMSVYRWSLQVRALHLSAGRAVSRPSSVVDSIIRVDHAGELGADRIYAGQMAVLGNSKMGPLIQHMWDQEKVHKATFEGLIRKHRVRPTALVPIWNVAGFMLGAGSALLGEKAAMACTVAVESVIVEHYNDQLRTLSSDPAADKDLLATIKRFRDEEQEHHDTGLEQGAEQAPLYQAMTQVIKAGCKAAIAISKGFLSRPGCHAQFQARCYSSITTDRSEPPQVSERWDLMSAVCVERKPVLSHPLSGFEKRYVASLAELELEQSMKSDHEMRHESDVRQAELLKTSNALELDVESTLQTARDLEDVWNDELSRFKLSGREIDPNPRSVKRKLESHLVLLINERLGEKAQWMLPKGKHVEGETLRQTAERILKEKFGSELAVSFFGNAPCGFYKYRYPRADQSQAVGAKVFFFKALYREGQPETQSYQWATRDELRQLVQHQKYLKSVEMFLIDEEKEEAVAN